MAINAASDRFFDSFLILWKKDQILFFL
jgi:hypothetical protein